MVTIFSWTIPLTFAHMTSYGLVVSDKTFTFSKDINTPRAKEL